MSRVVLMRNHKLGPHLNSDFDSKSYDVSSRNV